MDDEDKEMLREIRDRLLGTLDKQGFIGETQWNIEKIWGIIKMGKAVMVAVVIPILLLVAEKMVDMIK